MTEEKFADICVEIWRKKQALDDLHKSVCSITAKEYISELRLATRLHDAAVAQLTLPVVIQAGVTAH